MGKIEQFKFWDAIEHCWISEKWIEDNAWEVLNWILYKNMIPKEITAVMCTGLKDKNGKLIFEGDVVMDRGSDIGIIEWDNSWASFVISYTIYGNKFCKLIDNLALRYSRDEYEWIGQIESESANYYDWEIIGNKYENPKLLNNQAQEEDE